MLVSSRLSIGVLERRFGAVGLDIDVGVIVLWNSVGVVVAFTISWNATNALYKLLGVFFCVVLALVLVLVGRQFRGVVVDIDAEVIVPWKDVVGVVDFTIA